MKNLDKDQIKGLIATALFHAVLIIVLVLGYLYYSYPPKDEELAEMDKDEILFGGEYVTYGDFNSTMNDAPSASNEEPSIEPSIEGEDVVDEGVKGEAELQVVTGTEESPMKVKEKENPGPTKEELEAAERERIRKEEKSKEIKNRVKFGSTKDSGEGVTGTENGEKTASLASGVPAVTGLVGYTLESWGRPRSSKTGTVVVRVRVNARGNVISATAVVGSGSAWGDMAVRRSCEEESMKSKFSVPKNKSTEGVGEIVWRFE